MQPVPRRDVLGHRTNRDQSVGRSERDRFLDVDFVLTGAVLVVGARNAQAHRFERTHDLHAHVLAAIAFVDVEIRTAVAGIRRRDPVGAEFEEVEFGLEAAGHAREHVACILDCALQRRARATFEGLAVGGCDVTDQTRLLMPARRPRIDRKGREIRQQHHVRFLAAHEPVDGPAVKGNFAGDRALELRRRNHHALADAQDVDERHPDVAHVAFLYQAQDLAFVWRLTVRVG